MMATKSFLKQVTIKDPEQIKRLVEILENPVKERRTKVGYEEVRGRLIEKMFNNKEETQKEKEVKKYRKKPVIIEAVQYKRDENISSCMDFCPDMIYNHEDNEYDIVTLEGRMRITKGDFIIKGVNGEFYPCKPDIFLKSYEEVKGRIEK